MFKKTGKRCKNCGQINLPNNTVCISCKKEDGLVGVKQSKYLKIAFDSTENNNAKEDEEGSLFSSILITIGILGILYALNMDTTVGSVNNIGLMDDRRTTLIIFSLCLLVGFINRSSESKSNNRESQSADTRSCPYCAETIKIKAKLCKHCGKELTDFEKPQYKDENTQNIQNQNTQKPNLEELYIPPPPTSPPIKNNKTWGFLINAIWFIFLITILFLVV